jgi:hypothetical protein
VGVAASREALSGLKLAREARGCWRAEQQRGCAGRGGGGAARIGGPPTQGRRVVMHSEPTPAASPSASPLEAKRESIQADEGRGASSSRTAATAASARVVASRAQIRLQVPRPRLRAGAARCGSRTMGVAALRVEGGRAG